VILTNNSTQKKAHGNKKKTHEELCAFRSFVPKDALEDLDV